jgi:hypothetical protein
MHPWLAAVRHDLLKRVVWPARDQRDLQQRDLEALRRGLRELTDDEGRRVTAVALFQKLRQSAPDPAHAACDEFARALQRAEAALEEPWPAPLDQILALEPAFAALAREMERKA